MPKYFCDYCDTYLTHDSPTVRKTHCGGRKHKENVKFYYQKWMEEQAQTLIDATTAAFKVSKHCTATINIPLRTYVLYAQSIMRTNTGNFHASVSFS